MTWGNALDALYPGTQISQQTGDSEFSDPLSVVSPIPSSAKIEERVRDEALSTRLPEDDVDDDAMESGNLDQESRTASAASRSSLSGSISSIQPWAEPLLDDYTWRRSLAGLILSNPSVDLRTLDKAVELLADDEPPNTWSEALFALFNGVPQSQQNEKNVNWASAVLERSGAPIVRQTWERAFRTPFPEGARTPCPESPEGEEIDERIWSGALWAPLPDGDATIPDDDASIPEGDRIDQMPAGAIGAQINHEEDRAPLNFQVENVAMPADAPIPRDADRPLSASLPDESMNQQTEAARVSSAPADENDGSRSSKCNLNAISNFICACIFGGMKKTK